MKRAINQIIIRVLYSGQPVKEGCFHYALNPDGRLHKLKQASLELDNIPQADEGAIHIAYFINPLCRAGARPNGTRRQQEMLFNHLIGLTVKYPDAVIKGADEFITCPATTDFNVKQWLYDFEPLTLAA